MTLEEAIRHCYETAEKEECECSSEHLQLAHWLEELQRYRSAGKTKEKMTNEEWFCELPTEEKAETLAIKTENLIRNKNLDLMTFNNFKHFWESWLREEHK